MTRSPVPNQQRVLVADDERMIADTLHVILSRHGFEVTVAYEGRGAIEKAREFSPHILLCDVAMPRVNGIEAAIQIRSIVPECRVLFLTAQTNVFQRVQEAYPRPHDFEVLIKPIHPTELLARLRTMN